MNLSLNELIRICQVRLEKIFNHYLKNTSTPAPQLQNAMLYAVSNGGKRLRPLLVYATGHVLGAPWENLDAAASAIELIHAYSLIHDDLPAMDNADLRRGKPSCHKAFNEAIAILAGDGLQPLAFEIIATHSLTLSTEQRLAMIGILTDASGMAGMAAGQTLDIEGVNSLQALLEMYRLKTGALLVAAIKLGAIGANQLEHMASLEKFASRLGLAFQIQDDLLDIEKNAEQTGKPQGLDAANNKKTYPFFAGIESTRTTIQILFTEAIQALDEIGENANLLKELAYHILQRNY